MPNSSALQRHVAQKVGLCILLGVIVWVVLLIAGANHMRSAIDTNAYDVVIGPLALNHIAKSVAEGGHKVSISFEMGLLWYLFACTGVGALLGYGAAKLDARARLPPTNR